MKGRDSIMTRCGIPIVLPVMLGALLSACVSPTTPENSRSPWVPARNTLKADPVWPAVRGQTVDLSKPLSLAEAADLALRNNPASCRAWNDARAAAAQVRQVQGYFMPTITASVAASLQKTAADPDSFDAEVRKQGAGLQMNYLVLSFGGGRQAAVEQALQTVYALDFTFNRAIQDVMIGVESAYFGLISAEAGVEAANASEKDAKAALDAAQAILKAGVGTDLDVLQAQAAHDQSLYNLAAAQGQSKIARGTLALSLGLAADTPVTVVAPEQEIPAPLPETNIRSLIDESLARRPDIAALRATLSAKEAAVKVAGAGLWPLLYLNGNASRNNYDNTGGIPMQDSDFSYGAGISLQWTLFDGFQTVNAARVAREQAESTRSQLRQAELAASADVWVRYQAFETALKKYTFSAAFLKSATSSYDLALQSYKAGLKSVLDLLNAEDQLAQARRQNIAARQESFTALANLAYATGLLEKASLRRPDNLFPTTTQKDHRP